MIVRLFMLFNHHLHAHYNHQPTHRCTHGWVSEAPIRACLDTSWLCFAVVLISFTIIATLRKTESYRSNNIPATRGL